MRIATACLVCLICMSGLAIHATAQEVVVDPVTVTADLAPGAVQNVQINVTFPGSVPRGDVLFAFDATGSMGPVLDAMRNQGIQVMNDIRAVIEDTRFGALSFMDYPKHFDNYYGYSNTYGAEGDYDFLLDQGLTPDINAVSAAITRMNLGDGGDIPEDYGRAIYEARDLPWRTDAKKILVVFGDAPPHAAPGGKTLMNPWSTGLLFTSTEMSAPYGGDPGRDMAPSGHDIDYATQIQGAADDYISIVAVYCPYNGVLDDSHRDAENNFRYMAYKTGGPFVLINPNGDASLIADEIVSMIQAMAKQNIRELSVRVEEPGYAGWVTTPDSYSDVPWPSEKAFQVAISPPADAVGGDHTFHLSIVGDGIVLGSVTVSVHVDIPDTTPPVEVSLDIRPRDCPNSFNPGEKGVLPVAILGTDALKVSAIDRTSIRLSREGGSAWVGSIRTAVEDVSSPSTGSCSCGLVSGKKDKVPDLALKFDSQELVQELGIGKDEGCIKLTVTGTFVSDTGVPSQRFIGTDYLRVIETGKGSCAGDGGNEGKGPGNQG